MSKLVALNKQYWPNEDYGHWCPGCNSMHEIAVKQKNHSGASWTFDGNFALPTFSPSINMRVEHYQPDIASTVCHYFIRAGRIEFCGDSTHELRGKTVDLPDFPDGHAITCERL